MPNDNKKIVLNAEKELRKKAIKAYHEDNRLEFRTLFCVLCYAIIFGLISIINDTVFLSLILSIFSFATTFGFELIEWLNYRSNLQNKFLGKLILKYQTNALLIGIIFFLILVLPFCIYAKIDSEGFKQLTQHTNTHIPNIITSLTFVAYFISFYLRSYFKKRDSFIESFNKKFKQPYN